MNLDRNGRRPGCGPDGGESFYRSSSKKQADRKLKQLCRQVLRTLTLTLGGECGDPMLQELVVVDVTPAPDGSRLLVDLNCPAHVDRAEVYMRLADAQGMLRRSVAANIVRKRAPELAFRVIPVGGGAS